MQLIGFLTLSIISIILCGIQCAIAGIIVTLFNLALDVNRCVITLTSCSCSSGGRAVTYNGRLQVLELPLGFVMFPLTFTHSSAYLFIAAERSKAGN